MEGVLRKWGFDVMRDYVIEVGDVTHVVDVVATLIPIPGVEVRLAFIVLEKGLTLSDVERFFTWKHEGGFDKVVVIVGGRVPVEAYELAKRFGVDVVSVSEGRGVSIEELAGTYAVLRVEPALSLSDALTAFERLSKGFLRRRRELVRVVEVYIPYVDVEMEARFRGEESEEFRDVGVTFDGLRGALVVEEGGIPVINRERAGYDDFSDYALGMLRILVRDKYRTMDEVAAELKLGEGKVRSVANYLLHKELIDVYQDVVELRLSLFEKAVSLIKLLEGRGAKLSEGAPHPTPNRLVAYPRISIDKLMDFLQVFAAKVNSINIIYYPYFVGGLREPDGAVKLVAIDALTGEENPSAIWALSEVEELLENKLKLVR